MRGFSGNRLTNGSRSARSTTFATTSAATVAPATAETSTSYCRRHQRSEQREDVKGDKEEDRGRNHLSHFLHDSLSELAHDGVSLTDELTRTGLLAQLRQSIPEWLTRHLNETLERLVQLQDH